MEWDEKSIRGLFALGYGVYVIGRSIYQYLTDRRLLRGPSVAGKIVYSGAEGKWDKSSGSGGEIGGNYHYMYSPVFEYRYEVSGGVYTGDRVTLGKSSCSVKSWAEKQAAKYPVGAEVEVFYDESDPSVSMLESAAMKGVWLVLLLLVGLGLVGLGVYLLSAGNTA
ncbi:MAG: DUF3592 domain-containing protein [Verrucomicrobiota bacterium]